MARAMKTTLKDFALFQETFEYWAKEFGLMRYHLSFTHKDHENKDYLANIVRTEDALGASVHMCKTYNNPRNDDDMDPEALAFHECIHLLLSEFSHLAKQRHIDEYALEHAEETICSTLEMAYRRRLIKEA